MRAFSRAAAAWTSSVSDFEKPVTEIVSSSGPSSSMLPTIKTSGESGQDHSGPPESSNDDSVSDTDSVGSELSKLGTWESEELDLCLEPAWNDGFGMASD